MTASGAAPGAELRKATIRRAAPEAALEHRFRDHLLHAREEGLRRALRARPDPEVVGAPDLAMRWHFVQETIEDRSNRSLHRAGCPELALARELVRHPAGSIAARAQLPEECEDCRPTVEIVLGRAGGV